MTRRSPPGVTVGVLGITLTVVLTGCGDGALDPRGDGARTIASGWWLMLSMAIPVFAFVLVVLGVALWRGRRAQPLDDRDDATMTPLVIGAGVVLPSVVIAVLVAATVAMGADLAGDDDDALRIDVVGHQYWWDVEYPALGVRTANEIHIPADRPVELRLTSNDVIHSFWVPQLHGKIDLLPGRTTRLALEADEPGTYRGQCAEFCSIGHAFMELLVIAQAPADFDAWAEQQAAPARAPDTDRAHEGRQVFLGSSCVYCHRIEGTNATSDFGPDLTHLSSRRTLAAGVLPNTRGDLAGWILDPQHHKPGNQMPASRLEPEELQALLDYLQQLD